MIYLDASVLVAMITNEPNSIAAVAIRDTHRTELLVSDFAAGEVASALSRRARMNVHSGEDADLIWERFESWRLTETAQMTVSSADVALATTHVRRWDLKLRLPDAIHLATCRRLAVTLATFDVRLADAAKAIGVGTLAP